MHTVSLKYFMRALIFHMYLCFSFVFSIMFHNDHFFHNNLYVRLPNSNKIVINNVLFVSLTTYYLLFFNIALFSFHLQYFRFHFCEQQVILHLNIK